MLSFPCVDRSISLRIAPVVYPVLSLGDEKGHFCFSRVPKPDHTCCLLSEVWTVVVPSHATPLSPRNTHLFLFQFKGTTTNRASPKTCSHTNRRVTTTTSGEYRVSSPDICHRLPDPHTEPLGGAIRPGGARIRHSGGGTAPKLSQNL